MPVSRQLKINIAVGTLLSALFGALLVYYIMAGGVGTEITLAEFLSSPQNIIFTLLMCSFVFASWVMRGMNNRVVLFCWAFAIVIHEVILWAIYHYFYYRQTNIYVLNLVGIIATSPAVLFLRLRVTYSCWLLIKLVPLRIFRSEINHYLEYSKITDFEFYMLRVMYTVFFIECLYSLYMTVYALLYHIPSDDSIYEHMLNFKNWDPYSLYLPLLNILTSVYIAIICFYLIRDYRVPDSFNYGVSDKQKRDATQRMLEKRRAKASKRGKER